MDATFGSLLKSWRDQRRLSQLDLGLSANVSARHISFLETGRSKPSRTMIIQLSETLDIPREDRNALLNAAGFAPAYARRSLSDSDMSIVRDAIEWTMQRHDPFPAFALDRHWRLLHMNCAAAMLLKPIGLQNGDSLLDALTGPDGLRAALVNWQDVANHMVARLRTESAHLGGDAVLDRAASKLAQEIGTGAGIPPGPIPPVTPTIYRAAEATFSFFSTIAQFGSAQDIMLADMRVELLFPADEATRTFLLQMETPPASASGTRQRSAE